MKRIITIGMLHFVATVFSILVATFEMTEAIRGGSEEVGQLGHALHLFSNILAQPVASMFIQNMPRESGMFWLTLFINSIFWAVIISVLWGTLYLRKTNADTKQLHYGVHQDRR